MIINDKLTAGDPLNVNKRKEKIHDSKTLDAVSSGVASRV